MPPTGAKSAAGTQLQRGDGGSPEAFGTISEVVGVNGPERVREVIDATNLDSADNREVILSFLNNGEVTFDLNYKPNNAGHQALESDFTSGTLRNFKLVFTQFGSRTFAFAAYVTKVSPQAHTGAKVSASFTLTISGAVTAS